jgi:NAD(P)-dependent dehydrogenase (short-subunit alcohol dehydrogenase family)
MKKRTGIIAAVTAGVGLYALTRKRRTTLLDLRGKVVLITGGSRGLGLQLAREFGSHGAVIAICARDEAELGRAKDDLTSRGIESHTIVCDVTDPDQIQSMVKETARRLGPIDVLVNNAGIIEVGPVAEMTVADFERAMGVIFWGTLHSTLAVLPSMRERRSGSIVNITSIGGKVAVPHLLPYSCAKFAVVALSEGLRAELAPSGIRVTTIVPGLMRTGSHLQAEFKGKHQLEYAWFSAGAATSLVSISAERAARSIVEATIRGDSEKILSVPADLLARVHALFPELSVEILGLVNRLLPSASKAALSQTRTGADVHGKMNSAMVSMWEALIRPGQKAAESLNQFAAR